MRRKTTTEILDLVWQGRVKSGPTVKQALRTMRCFYCGGPGGTVDHWVPLALGGDDTVTNWRPCCGPCNNEKGDLSPEAWSAHCADDDQRQQFTAHMQSVDGETRAPWWSLGRFTELRTDIPLNNGQHWNQWRPTVGRVS